MFWFRCISYSHSGAYSLRQKRAAAIDDDALMSAQLE
jgi:hypothetical protein